MKRLLLCACVIWALGCKKKDETAAPPAAGSSEMKAPAAGAAPAGSAAAAPAMKPAEPAVELPEAGVLPECDAVAATYKKFQGCAKIKEEDRVVQDMNVGQLKGIVDAYKTTTDKDQKEIAKGAAAKQCKDQDDKLKMLLADAGC